LAGCEQPQEALAASADHDARAAGVLRGADQLVHVVEQREVVRRGLAEADAGVDPDLGHAGGHGAAGTLDHETVDLGHHVPVVGVGLHGPGLALHVHGHPAGPGGRRHLPQRGRDVVDEGGADGQGGLGHLPLDGVDGDADAGSAGALGGVSVSGGPGQGLDDRDDPPQLDLDGDGLGAGPGGFAAHVDDVGALGHHLEPVRHRALEGVVEAAVGEGVRRHVEDAHDERAQRRRHLWRVGRPRRHVLSAPG